MREDWHVLKRVSPNGSMVAGIFVDEDGFWISTPQGYWATLEEAQILAEQVVRTAREHRDEIVEHNRNNNPYELFCSNKDANGSSKAAVKPQHVYLFKCGDKHKIGISCNVKRRMRELDNRPYPLELIACSALMRHAFDAEQRLHEEADSWRLSGEWFDFDDKVLGKVKRIIDGLTDDVYESLGIPTLI